MYATALQLSGEQFLIRKLVERHLMTLARMYAGTTDFEIRRERIRTCIVACGVADEHVGTRKGIPRTFAAAFEDLYQQPLQSTNP